MDELFFVDLPDQKERVAIWKILIAKYGRDPATGTIIPRFKPPSGLSPAGCRYILKMSLDKNAFTAAIISLAVKGWLEIIESGDDYTLDHSAYVFLINPQGDFQGFMKPPFDAQSFSENYLAIRKN